MSEPDSGRRGIDSGLWIERAYDHSRFGRAVGAVARYWRSTVGPAAAGSRSAVVVRAANSTVDRILSLVVTSTVVRWVSRPPAADVIVVDLRESALVGPVCPRLRAVLATVNAAFDDAESYWNGSWMGTAIRERPLRVAGVTVLCLLGLWFATAWPDVTRISLGAASVVAGAALLGIQADATAANLAETTTGRIVVALVLPPGGVE